MARLHPNLAGFQKTTASTIKTFSPPFQMYSVINLLTFTGLLGTGLPLASAEPKADQAVMESSEQGKSSSGLSVSNVPKIAVIGAAITGVSSAHHLHQLVRRLQQPLEISVLTAMTELVDVFEVHTFMIKHTPLWNVAQQLLRKMIGA